MGCCILGALAISELILLYQTIKRHRTWMFAAAGGLAAAAAVAWLLLVGMPQTSGSAYVLQLTCRSGPSSSEKL
ncbi:MAG TPA: hypothetical protein VJS42_00195 [Steroidobacteraceae bacterium]|nr:hypothetical protein [Steroidobacteraceae bacterium]